MKKLVLSIMVVLMLFTAAPSRIQAQTNTAAISTTSISYTIACGIADLANKAVDTVICIAKITRVDDAAKAVAKCEAIIECSTAVINAMGYEVECIYESYTIDGHIVSIDPIRVITPIDDPE